MIRLRMAAAVLAGLSSVTVGASPAMAEYCNGADLVETWCKDPAFGTWCMYFINLPNGSKLCVVGHETGAVRVE